ncbi:MAG: alpha-galactosidase [Clostridia bacterium]|nr:alpha-galactosidase [Clostridia bacterium]
MKQFTQLKKASELWDICGDFGEFDGDIRLNEATVSCMGDALYVCSEFKKDGDITSVTGKIKNISDKALTLTSVSYRFYFDGGEYDVYSQYNGWQNESMGEWQPLVTGVSVMGKSIRTAQSAVPFMCLWNRQSGRGTVFHMLPDSLWKMSAERLYKSGEVTYIEARTGVYEHNFSLLLYPGEEFEMPRIIYYTASNKTDMDCYKLHNFINSTYPRRKMPVIYNTWLCRFDKITYENVINQVPLAAQLGVEYFVIDAGWFGQGSEWTSSRGDWTENKTGTLCGRMKDIADEVRRYGMKFGFWIEMESADKSADIVKSHPEYFISGDVEFLDFSRDDVCEYMFETISGLIEKYGAEFIKFDFNADLYYDKKRSGFMKYFNGYTGLIKKLRASYPALYMENCSSGGARMELKNGLLFDSFWLSDNQSPFEGTRIFKDTILRIPPQWIECWAVIKGYKGYVYPGVEQEKIISVNDAAWDNAIEVKDSYLRGFLTGSPIGLSFDLTTISDTVFNSLKGFISDFKKDREFWLKANCRILTDTKDILVLQFSDECLCDLRILVFSGKVRQDAVTVFPIIGEDNYTVDNKEILCEDISQNGISVPIKGNYQCEFVNMKKRRK